ncbi:MAG: RIP metalloprotease RseP [Leptolyngbya sp.]|nr:MAG: RIP metalloprotease RseP [Leptolyngbya sp.]
MFALPAIAVLALLIVVHELGHFMAARLQGIYASKFSIGFGPVLWKYQGPETEYALRAFPLGGFVGFPEEDPEENTIDPKDPNLLKNRPILDRAIVMSAGVIANLIFAYLVLVLQMATVGAPQAEKPGVLVSRIVSEVTAASPKVADLGIKVGDTVFFDQKFDYTFNPQTNTAQLVVKPSEQAVQLPVQHKSEGSKPELAKISLPANAVLTIDLKPNAAMRYGLKPGDVIVSADGRTFGQAIDEQGALRKIIEVNPGKPVDLSVQRGDQLLTLAVTPEEIATGEGRIGAGLDANGALARKRVGGLAAFSAAAAEFQKIVYDTVEGFGMLVSRFNTVASQVAGPVAIVAAGSRITQSDAANLFYFAALISVNLAIINILPLPALDGGHLAFLLLEGLRGKPVPSKIQDGVMQTGLMLLLGLGIFLIIRDTANLIPQ